MTWPHASLPLLLVPLLLAAVACTPPPEVPQDPATQPQRDALHRAGVTTALVLHPVRVLGRGDENVAAALGLVLERSGMSQLALADQPFDAAQLPWEQVPPAFGEVVRKATAAGKAGAHHLYAEFLGDPRSGPTEVRFVLLDDQGAVVLVDRQLPADPTFRRTAGRDPDPLGCATLVAERLFQLAGWQKVAGGVPDGPFVRRWKQRSGMPDEAGLQLMAERRAALAKLGKEARVVVLPTLWQGKADPNSAARLADELARQFGWQAAAATGDAATALQVAPSSNQQQRLWGLVHAAEKALQARAAAADYVVVADLGITDDGKSGYAQLALLTAAGEPVVADFANDQHALFRRLAPRTLEDLEKLAASQLAAALR